VIQNRIANNRINRISRRRTKAVSPILGEIIILAITVVLGVVVGNYIFGLMGGYTEASNVQVSGVPVMNNPQGTLNITLSNQGSISDSVQSIRAVVAGTTYTATIDSAKVINGGGGNTVIDATFVGAPILSGGTYTLRISMTSGNNLAVTAVAL
jgi:flagellin-like protein